MNKLLASAIIATMVLFSVAAIAQVIPTESLDFLYRGEFGYYYKWLFVGLGLLCFIELRREE